VIEQTTSTTAGAAATDDAAAEADERAFRISATPVAESGSAVAQSTQGTEDLPRSYGSDFLLLLPRNPQRFFAFWDINWPVVFTDVAAGEREVRIRVLKEDGNEESGFVIEPMRGTCDLTVSLPGATYRAQIGYFAANEWRTIAESPPVVAPVAAAASANTEADFASIPFHLSFQRLTEIFRRANKQGQSLVRTIGRLEQTAGARDSAALSQNEAAMLDQSRIEISQIENVVRAYEAARAEAATSRNRVFENELSKITPDATSPGKGFGGASSSAQPPSPR
jgi:hypothetical protein